MSVDKIDLEALRVEASPEVTLLNLEDYKVLPTDKIERPKPLLSIIEGNTKKDLLKLSSVSLLYGQEKSRKSTFLRAIVQGVIKGYNEKLKCEFKDVDACIIDTEQNRDEIQFSLQSIKYLSGRYIDYYSFVELAFKDKMALTEQYLDNHPNTKLLIIDNLSDFLSDNSSIISNDITLDEGEITTTDKQGNTTSIKGKNISTKNNKSEQSFTSDYKKEIEKINELSEYKIDSAINKIDSTYEAKYEQSHKELKTTYDKKTNRFSFALILVSALVLLVYAILKRHKIV